MVLPEESNKKCRVRTQYCSVSIRATLAEYYVCCRMRMIKGPTDVLKNAG